MKYYKCKKWEIELIKMIFTYMAVNHDESINKENLFF